MKKIISLLALFLVAGTLNLPAQNYDVGDMNLSLNIGIGSGLLPEGIKLPPTSLQLEYGIAENLGVGILVGYAATDYEINLYSGNTVNFETDHFLLGALGQYHFYSSESANMYAKAMLGYDLASSEFIADDGLQQDDFDDKNPSLIYGIHLGALYYFSDATGAFAEIGYGLSIFNVGLSLRL
ncbi:MAG: hypothetical protein R6T91_08385 [Bacteroidales bacterium]